LLPAIVADSSQVVDGPFLADSRRSWKPTIDRLAVSGSPLRLTQHGLICPTVRRDLAWRPSPRTPPRKGAPTDTSPVCLVIKATLARVQAAARLGQDITAAAAATAQPMTAKREDFSIHHRCSAACSKPYYSRYRLVHCLQFIQCGPRALWPVGAIQAI